MKLPRVVTHSGSFQPDDVFAVAALELMLGEIELVRTRDSKEFPSGDYVVDVGDIYDPASCRFDHHQAGGAGKRDNGLPYSAFGLVWKTYGSVIAGGDEVARRIDERLVQSIDADDHGIEIFKQVGAAPVYSFVEAIYNLNPTWKEPDSLIDGYFKEAVAFAKRTLERMIERERTKLEAETIIELAYKDASDKRIIVLDGSLPAQDILGQYPEPLYVVKPARQGSQWKVQVVDEPGHTHLQRKPFPAEWAAKRDAGLISVTGVPDAVLCHQLRFVAVAKSKEGAIALAKLATEA